ncbi:sugar-binding transcriptional regulator [Dialister sp.]|jgi:central glycolytic genes regulator|uniref:sugar-binding transcriptional regulator n=2 Tax=Dialister TaxID=39948 RepID=UPI0025D9174F|nr:sugar-binding domain-containing protein [Dialister sp.]
MKVKEDSLLMLLLPEMMEGAQERYEILRQIHEASPVGRHILAVQTKLSESTIRKHIEKMEEAGLLISRPSGMSLTSKGESLVAPLAPYLQKSPSLSYMERKLESILSMEKVIVVRGDSDRSPEVSNEISQEGALVLLRILRDGHITAVSGGPEVAGIANALPALHMKVDVVPARGGFGRKIEYLPNLVAARMAERLGGTYHLMTIPDGLSPELFLKVKKELPQLKVIDEMLAKADILITGVEDSRNAAEWMELPKDVTTRLAGEGAAGEALGLFTDIHGKVLYRMYNAGISGDDISSIPHVLIAAGGSHKGAAILAMARAGIRGTLITDEGAGNEILSLMAGKESKTGGY